MNTPVRWDSPATPPVGASEPARKRLVGVVLVIYLLAIFEGALRKYAFPEFGQYIFFIRDPVLVYAYLLATRHGLWPRHSANFKFSVFLCGFGLLLFGLQSVLGSFSEHRLLLGVYGWRSYFLYIPLAFLVGEQFRTADLVRFAKITLLLAVPIAVLVGMQFFSHVNDVINVGTAEETELKFKGMYVTAAHVRPAGPFTSNAGQQQFVTSAFAMLLAFLIAPSQRRKVGLLILVPAAAGIMSCVALSGSRGTMLQTAMIAMFALSMGFVGRGAALKAKAFALPAAMAAAAIVLYPVVFPEGFEAFVARWNAADAYESRGFEWGVFGRALYSVIDFLRLVDDTPILGYGLGFGGNASHILGATVDGVKPSSLVETDYARHMVDLGPVVGICFIAYRVTLVVWLARMVLAATRRAPDPLPMMLFAYVFYVVLQAQITGNGSINVYGWLFMGLCIAAAREALRSNQTAAVVIGATTEAPRYRPAWLSRPPVDRSATPRRPMSSRPGAHAR
jgi:hypothetical protein